MVSPHGPLTDVASVLERVKRPKRAVVTAGMPYANGPVHIGHLAGAQLPADIMTRYLGLMIGRENVLFVCGTDEHGSTSEVSALQSGKPIRRVHGRLARQARPLHGALLDRARCVHRYVSPRVLSDPHARVVRTSSASCMTTACSSKRHSRQWYDPKMQRFLQDRFVRGTCPNPRCENPNAYSDECERCGHQYDPSRAHRSAEHDQRRHCPSCATPSHWWLDMWKVAEPLRAGFRARKRPGARRYCNEVIDTRRAVAALRQQLHEPKYKELKAASPSTRASTRRARRSLLQFETKAELDAARAELTEPASRTSCSTAGPIARSRATSPGASRMPGASTRSWTARRFTSGPTRSSRRSPSRRSRLKAQGSDPALATATSGAIPTRASTSSSARTTSTSTCSCRARCGSARRQDPQRLPGPGELQLTDVFGCFHLLVNGEKMSKSRGQLLTRATSCSTRRATPRTRSATSWRCSASPEKASNFDFATLDERNSSWPVR